MVASILFMIDCSGSQARLFIQSSLSRESATLSSGSPLQELTDGRLRSFLSSRNADSIIRMVSNPKFSILSLSVPFQRATSGRLFRPRVSRPTMLSARVCFSLRLSLSSSVLSVRVCLLQLERPMAEERLPLPRSVCCGAPERGGASSRSAPMKTRCWAAQALHQPDAR